LISESNRRFSLDHYQLGAKKSCKNRACAAGLVSVAIAHYEKLNLMLLTALFRWFVHVPLVLVLSIGFSGLSSAQNADAVHGFHAKLRDRLSGNQFQAPLYIDSTQTQDSLKGDVYAVIEHPFTEVKSALMGAEGWCDLLILHLNVKFCATAGKESQETISIVIGRKTERHLNDGYKLDFNFIAPAATENYLRVEMLSHTGPFNTRDYYLVLEAVSLESNKSFVHFSYKYAYGMMARMAMQAYLLTAGRDKIGFSITGKKADGSPVYIAGVRGAVERNAMRYYLAIQAFLDSLGTPPASRLEKRLGEWFSATEKYAPQLHELERDEYLSIKRREVQRQHTLASGKPAN
jgi:hypothetical protein